MTGLQDSQGLTIQDQATFREMEQVLHCTEKSLAENPYGSETMIHIGVAFVDPETQSHRWTGFTYSGNPKGHHTLVQDGEEMQGVVVVPPRFARRFEDLVSRMAQRAQTPGSHPEIIIGSHLPS